MKLTIIAVLALVGLVNSQLIQIACPTGYKLNWEGLCKDCDYQNGYNKYDSINCLKCDAKTEHWANGCVCNWDYRRVNNVCESSKPKSQSAQACPTGYKLNWEGLCKDCESGYNKYDGDNCVKLCDALTEHWESSAKRCVCNWEYERVNNACVKPQSKN